MGYEKPVVVRVIKVVLDVSYVLAIIFGTVIVIWLGVSPFVMSGNERTVYVPLMVAIDEAAINPPPRSETAGIDGSAEVEVGLGIPPEADSATTMISTRTSSWSAQFLIYFSYLIACGFILWELLLLRRIARTALEGHPFAASNVSRLKWIGIIQLAGCTLAPIAHYFMVRAVLDDIVWGGATLVPPFDFDSIGVLSGLMILALATVFKYGRRLEEDQSLTV